MSWTVYITKSADKARKKLPKNLQDILSALIIDLQNNGPARGDWRNYSKLADKTHHCHLNYGFVACWSDDKKNKTVEIYYVGSRKDAPYA